MLYLSGIHAPILWKEVAAGIIPSSIKLQIMCMHTTYPSFVLLTLFYLILILLQLQLDQRSYGWASNLLWFYSSNIAIV